MTAPHEATILHLEDSELDAELIAVWLTRLSLPFSITRAANGAEFLPLLKAQRYDIILSDYQLPDIEGLSALELAQQEQPDVPFIFISGTLGEEVAVDTLKLGATDYVLKQRLQRLVPAVERALHEAEARAERLRMEDALRESEQQFRTLANSIPHLAWMADERGDIIWYNQRWYAYTGATADAMEKDSWEAVHDPQLLPEVMRRWQESIATATPFDMTFPLRGADGVFRPFLTRVEPVHNRHGAIVRWFGTHTDISEQREAQETLLVAKNKAEEASRAKSEFLANLSHEIRTPMNAVVGIANILHHSSPLTEKQRQFVATLKDSADNLLALINDMLDFARIEDESVQLEAITFNLKELVEKVVGIQAIQAREKGLKLSMDYSHAMPDCFIGDPLRIRQIVNNLISNAIKFTEHGHVDVRVAGNTIDAAETQIVVQVSDTGIGVPVEKQALIFEKFTQADASTTRKYGGSGLGLAICTSLTKLMGGHIALQSAPGNGSVFTLELTLRHTQADKPANTEPMAKSNAPTRRGRILLVEDYPANILVAKTMLEQFGYDYDIARNGLEALEKFKTSRYAAILMDIQMQGMDGYETTRQLRAQEKQRGLPAIAIIAMTAHALHGDKEKCLNAGMNDYIAKPFNPADLQKKLTHALA